MVLRNCPICNNPLVKLSKFGETTVKYECPHHGVVNPNAN